MRHSRSLFAIAMLHLKLKNVEGWIFQENILFVLELD